MSRRPSAKTHATPETILDSIVAESSARVPAQCRHFGECGGCHLQHLAYKEQLTAKRQMLVQILNNAGVTHLPEIETHTAEPWHYRNRIRMRVQGNEVGYSRRASHGFLPIDECPIASPLLLQTAFALRNLVREGTIQWPGGAIDFELFTNAEEQLTQLTIHVDATLQTIPREAPAQFRKLCDLLKKRVPQLAGAGLLVNAPDASLSRRIQSTQRIEVARWGTPELAYSVAGYTYSATRNAFFQVNRFLTDAMVATVVDRHSGELAFDLFAGVGLFSVPLAQRFAQVTSVEISEAAVADLRKNLASIQAKSQIVNSTTEAFLQRATGKPDLVVMDPPRAGVSLAALRSLVRLDPQVLVYVSCDAATFARDTRTLLESGYTPAALYLFDLFPQTFHTETIALFRH